MSDDPIILHIHPEIKTRHTKQISWKTFFIDKLKFFGTAIAIFVITFLALNWSSYQQIFIDKWNQWTGEKKESLFQELVKAESEIEKEPLKISVLDVKTDLSNKIPPLNIDVAPPDTRIIIPRINQNVPVIKVPEDNLRKRDWDSLEKDIQESLKGGIVHYPGTSWPDEGGNFVVTGHSSYYPWDPGRFKDVFVLLHNVVIGDRIVVFYKQKKYVYQVYEIKEVYPSEVNILGKTENTRLTLITCTPIGTNLKRLIVSAELVK